ncbi:hypothetical protein FLGE108171_15210 [Flavobacterium gelidilacus]|uniref:hypothetical protein n=1 Tax=Flavobacterium gelidilacus TaxID=206041 RepID=UPI00041BD884|nr:hypothetical protein [Flavobacterium gelidilacus]
MKKIIYIILILFISCKSQNKEFNTLGDKLISDENFVNSIESSCDKETNPNCELNKLTFNYQLKFKKDSIVYNNNNLRIEINKEEKVVYENGPKNTALKIITFNNNNLVDTLTIYHKIYLEEVVLEKKYYLNKKFELWILDFFIDDEGVFIKKWNKFKIDEKTGKISLLNELIKDKYHLDTKGIDNSNTLDTYINEYGLSKFKIRKDFDFDFNNDAILDKIIAFDYEDSFDCSPNAKGERPLLILKGLNNNKFELVKYSIEILPSFCSSGNAESDLDIYYKEGLFHFHSTYLNQSNEIYSRDYFFKNDLELEKIIFLKTRVGNQNKNEKKITQKDFSKKVSLLNFVFEESLQYE